MSGDPGRSLTELLQEASDVWRPDPTATSREVYDVLHELYFGKTNRYRMRPGLVLFECERAGIKFQDLVSSSMLAFSEKAKSTSWKFHPRLLLSRGWQARYNWYIRLSMRHHGRVDPFGFVGETAVGRLWVPLEEGSIRIGEHYIARRVRGECPPLSESVRLYANPEWLAVQRLCGTSIQADASVARKIGRQYSRPVLQKVLRWAELCAAVNIVRKYGPRLPDLLLGRGSFCWGVLGDAMAALVQDTGSREACVAGKRLGLTWRPVTCPLGNQ